MTVPDANAAFIVLASVQGAFTVVLAGATIFYAARTHDISEAARDQAKATALLVGATVRPVIVQWIDATPLPQAGDRTAMRIAVHCKNFGNGPAINMKWSLDPGGHILERVGMGVHEPEELADFGPQPGVPSSVAVDYEDTLGAKWRATLRFVRQDGRLGNGKSTFERIDQRESCP